MYHVTHLIQVLLMYRPKKNIFFCTSQDPIEFYDIIEYYSDNWQLMTIALYFVHFIQRVFCELFI